MSHETIEQLIKTDKIHPPKGIPPKGIKHPDHVRDFPAIWEILTRNVADNRKESTVNHLVALTSWLSEIEVAKTKATTPNTITETETKAGKPHTAQEAWVAETEIKLSNEEALDKDTYLLTTKGWVKITDINHNSEIAQYHPGTQTISFTKPQQVTQFEAEYRYKFTNTQTGVVQIVSPNHRMHFERLNPDTGMWEDRVCLAHAYESEVKKGETRLRVAAPTRITRRRMTDAEKLALVMQLLPIHYSDGEYTIECGFGNVEPVQEYARAAGVTVKSTTNYNDDRYSVTLAPSREISKQLHPVFRGYRQENGNHYTHDYMNVVLSVSDISCLPGHHYRISAPLAKTIQEAAFAAGYKTTRTGNTIDVSITSATTPASSDLVVEKLDGDTTYCVTVPTTFIVAKHQQSTTPVITGNCLTREHVADSLDASHNPGWGDSGEIMNELAHEINCCLPDNLENQLDGIISSILSHVIYEPHMANITYDPSVHDTQSIRSLHYGRMVNKTKPNSNQCIWGNTLILTNKGYIRANEINNDNSIEIACYNPNTQQITHDSVFSIIGGSTLPAGMVNTIKTSPQQLFHVATTHGPRNLTALEISQEKTTFWNHAPSILENKPFKTSNEGTSMPHYATGLLVTLLNEAGFPTEEQPEEENHIEYNTFRMPDELAEEIIKGKYSKTLKQARINEYRYLVIDAEKLPTINIHTIAANLNEKQLEKLYDFAATITQKIYGTNALTHSETLKKLKQAVKEKTPTQPEAQYTEEDAKILAVYSEEYGEKFWLEQPEHTRSMCSIMTPTGYYIARSRNEQKSTPVIMRCDNANQEYDDTIRQLRQALTTEQKSDFIKAVNNLAQHHINITPCLYPRKGKNFIKLTQTTIIEQVHSLATCVGAPIHVLQMPTQQKGEIMTTKQDKNLPYRAINLGDDRHYLTYSTSPQTTVELLRVNTPNKKTNKAKYAKRAALLAAPAVGTFSGLVLHSAVGIPLSAVSILAIIAMIACMVLKKDDTVEVVQQALGAAPVSINTVNTLARVKNSRSQREKEVLQNRRGTIIDAFTNDRIMEEDMTRLLDEMIHRVNNELDSLSDERKAESKTIADAYLDADAAIYSGSEPIIPELEL